MKIGIIGAGPAGISCGIQLKRYGINSRIFERDEIGSALKEPYKIHNFLGFPSGIKGKKFQEKIKKMAKNYNLKIIFDEIKELNYLNEKFILKGKKTYKFEILVVASGTRPKKYKNLECFSSLKKVKNKNGKEIGIIGGSDVAFDYSLSLKNAGKIYIFHRSSKPKAIKELQKAVFLNKNIKYLNNCKILNIEKLKGKIKLTYIKKGKKENILLDFLLNATGREAEKSFFSPEFRKTEKKLIKKG
ncbi:MAG: NAD(P)/FAD-dependent oxidoreductase, partial [Thermoanaerobaculia bacterium]